MYDTECPELGVYFSENILSGLLFTDDFVGVAETRAAIQKLIDIVCTVYPTGNFGSVFNLAIWRLKCLWPNFKFANNI